MSDLVGNLEDRFSRIAVNFLLIFIYRFLDVQDQSGTGDTFSWNPCNPFDEGTCSGVAVRHFLVLFASISKCNTR